MNFFRTVVYYLIYPICRLAFFLVHPVFHVSGRENIPTEVGETLSWQDYQYALSHSTADWPGRTDILYAGKDNLTPRKTVEVFAARPKRTLTVMEEGEHWFHTPEQLAVLERWTIRMLAEEGKQK